MIYLNIFCFASVPFKSIDISWIYSKAHIELVGIEETKINMSLPLFIRTFQHTGEYMKRWLSAA